MSALKAVGVTDGRVACGPYALSCVTGRPVSEFVPRTGKHGMMTAEFKEHLTRCGLRFETLRWSKHTGRRTRVWRALRAHRRGIVLTRNHAIACDGFLLNDNRSGMRWVHDHEYSRATIECMLVIKGEAQS